MKYKSSLTLYTFSIIILSIISCQKSPEYPEFKTWVPYDETALLDSSKLQDNERLQFKIIQSKVLDKNELLETIRLQLDGFSKEDYVRLAPLLYERSIDELQSNVKDNKLSYRELTQWYLYRIAITETDKSLGLNTVIAINPNAVKQAEALDNNISSSKHSIYGMPVLLKDNINTAEMKTTAGALALAKNQPTEDAQIVKNLKSNGAIILGKVNLSEWANFLCAGCPNGYSAIGGQTLNPYGPRKLDTGGSSSGSAVSVAINYAVGAIGSETSGSILSPSSQQSLVGLKPTVKKLSQDGIVPISSTLDTPGPITRTVEDNAILYSAMLNPETSNLKIKTVKLSELRLGAFKAYMQDSLYKRSIDMLKDKGIHIEILEPEQMDFSGFLALLNGDMKRDLKTYLQSYASDSIEVRSVADVVKFNKIDSVLHMPYAQARLDGILEQDLSDAELDSVRQKLITSGKAYFDNILDPLDLDAIVSMNNYNAGQAAVAKYPAITVPMGYKESGEPMGITFITKSEREELLLSIADFYEKLSQFRKEPNNYGFSD